MFTYRNSAYKLTLLFFVVNKIDAKKQKQMLYLYWLSDFIKNKRYVTGKLVYFYRPVKGASLVRSWGMWLRSSPSD